MVGWGLTIGGNRGSAMTLIGNTGSISLIIFGLYLILMRGEYASNYIRLSNSFFFA